MPDQSTPRRRFRLLRWSLFGLALVGLGFLLNNWLLPQPRCIIPISHPVEILWLADNGRTILTSPARDFEGWKAWDTHTGRRLGTYLKEICALQSSATSPGGRFVAVLDREGDLYLVDLKMGRESKTLRRFHWNGVGLTFSAKGTFLVVRDSDTHLVESSTGRVEKSFQNLTFFRFMPDETILFAADGVFALWDPRTQKAIRTFKGVKPFDLSPDGRTVLAESLEKWIPVFFDLQTQKSRPLDPPISLYDSPIQFAFSPNGKTLVTFPESQIAFWDVATGKRRHTEKRSNRDPGKYLFSPDSAFFLLACDGPGGLSLWDTASGSCLWKREGSFRHWGIEGEQPPQISILFTADSKSLFVPGEWGVEIVDAKTGETGTSVSQLDPGPEGLPTGPFNEGREYQKCTKDGSLFSTREFIGYQGPGFVDNLLGEWWPAGNTNQVVMIVKVVETATGRILGELEGPYGNGHLSNDGQTMVTGYRERDGKLSLRIWDLPLRPPLRLVIGIPLGLGLIVLVFSRWRVRQRVRSEASKAVSAASSV